LRGHRVALDAQQFTFGDIEGKLDFRTNWEIAVDGITRQRVEPVDSCQEDQNKCAPD
jgi:hypothetical protein